MISYSFHFHVHGKKIAQTVFALLYFSLDFLMLRRENRNIMIMAIIEMLGRKGFHEGFLIRILRAALLLHHRTTESFRLEKIIETNF